MPAYEYKCTVCGHEFEIFQKINDPPFEACPECGGMVTKMIGTGTGFVVKNRTHDMGITEYGNTPTHCGRDTTCCGRATRCDKRPCDE